MNKKKNKGTRSAQMQEVSGGLQDVLGMTQWREAHPKATLREIEDVVDAQIHQLRAQLIQELVQMGEEGEWSAGPAEARPRCERCGTALVWRGKQTRYLQTNGGEAIKLERRYGTCPQCGQGLFPPG
jgi:ribosomal protein S27AE